MSDNAELQDEEYTDDFPEEFKPDEPEPEVAEEKPEPEPEKRSPAEKMYIDKDAWVESGRDPSKWVPPEVFAERTERINVTQRLSQKLKQQEKEFEDRLKNVNTFQQAQVDRLRRELESKRDEAIDVADKGEVKRLDKELKDLDDLDTISKPAPQQVQGIPPEVTEWNAENQWLTADHPLNAKVNKAYAEALEDGKTIAGALRAVDKMIAQESRVTPEAAKKAPRSIVDSPRGTNVQKSQSNMSWDSLSSQDKAIYDELWSDTTTKAEFLKIISDSKKGL